MLPIPQSRGEATFALLLFFALLIIWSTLLTIRGPGLFYDPQPALLLLPAEQEDGPFLRHAMALEFPSPIDYEPIRKVCTDPAAASSDVRFRPGLLFSCEEQHGGVGMVRSEILKCMRYAIHAGAALVIPSMAKRNPKDISDIETSTEVPLEYLFDREAFVEHVTQACPGMRLYNHAEEFPGYVNRATNPPLQLLGSRFEPDHPRTGISDPMAWRGQFDAWLVQGGVGVSPENPVHVQIGQSYLDYPVHNDSLAFISEFGKLLSFRADARALAARVLLQLDQRFGLGFDPGRAVNGNMFFGAHLRLEKDAVEAWTVDGGWAFSDRETQFREVYEEVRRSGMRVVYVACGDQDIVHAFSQYVDRRLDAEATGERGNITIVTKAMLLSTAGHEHDLARLNALTFDQQGLVDFLIMFKASFFMGVAHSSFPWTVALRRHELSIYRDVGEGGDGGYANLGSDLLRDEFSVIMGMRKDYPYVDPFEWGLWP